METILFGFNLSNTEPDQRNISLVPLQFKTTFLKQNAFHSSHLPPLYPIMPLYHNHNFFLLLSLPCFLAWFLRVLAVRLLKTYSILHSKVIILYLYCIWWRRPRWENRREELRILYKTCASDPNVLINFDQVVREVEVE